MAGVAVIRKKCGVEARAGRDLPGLLRLNSTLLTNSHYMTNVELNICHGIGYAARVLRRMHHES